jgi:serine/threonine protein kinase
LFLRTFEPLRFKPLDNLVPEATEDARELMQRLLTFDPSRRLTAAHAMMHSFFRSYPLQELKGVHPFHVPLAAFEHEKWKPNVDEYRMEILKEGKNLSF